MVNYDFTFEDALGQVPVDSPGELASALALTDYEPLFDRLRQYNRTGRPPYCVRAMWRAVQTKYLLGVRYDVELVALLRSNRAIADTCGFGDTTPSESILCRFFKRLTKHQDLVDDALTQLRDRLINAVNDRKQEHEPPVGEIVAIDSTDVESFANHRITPASDTDARWGHRTPKHPTGQKDQNQKNEWFLGYKVHQMCDAHYGIPLGHMVLPANANDSPQLPKVFDQVRSRHPALPMRYGLADRGYDASSNYRYLEDCGISPVILMRNTNKDGIHTTDGRPKCLGGKPMDFIGTHREKGYLFRCPAGGCRLKDKVMFSRHCDTEIYERPDPDDSAALRVLGGSRLARASLRWRRYYRMRPAVERLFSSLKQSRLLNLHRYRQQRKVTLHIALSNQAYMATMLVRVLAGDMAHMRKMRLAVPAGFIDTSEVGAAGR